jgi:hypothetical protein
MRENEGEGAKHQFVNTNADVSYLITKRLIIYSSSRSTSPSVTANMPGAYPSRDVWYYPAD